MPPLGQNTLPEPTPKRLIQYQRVKGLQTHHLGGQHYRLNTFPLSVPLAFPVNHKSLFQMCVCVCPPDSERKYSVFYVYLCSCIML